MKEKRGNMDINIEMSSILSHRTEMGMVEFTITEMNDDGFPTQQVKTQWDIRKAKEIRDMLSEAIEAAITDTIIFKFMHERVGLDKDKAALTLLDFREIRQGSKEIVRPT